jgi:hypothetical protein
LFKTSLKVVYYTESLYSLNCKLHSNLVLLSIIFNKDLNNLFWPITNWVLKMALKKQLPKSLFGVSLTNVLHDISKLITSQKYTLFPWMIYRLNKRKKIEKK